MVKTGTGTLTLTSASGYSGGTTVNAGTLIGTSASAVGSNSSLTVASSATFAYQPSAAGALNLGSGTITLNNGSTIGTALGGTASQSAITGAAAVTGGTLNVNVYGIPATAVASGANSLITAASGLNRATYLLGNVYNDSNFTVSGLTASVNALSVTAGTASPLSAEYWQGRFSGGNNVWAISDGTTSSNWAADQTGTATNLTPGPTATVYFAATGGSNQGATVLGANMSVLGISVGGALGMGLNADGNTLTLGTGGVTVNSGAGATTLGAAIVLNGPQTWTNNSASLLSMNGNVANGGSLLTIAGSGNTAVRRCH